MTDNTEVSLPELKSSDVEVIQKYIIKGLIGRRKSQMQAFAEGLNFGHVLFKRMSLWGKIKYFVRSFF